MYHIYSKEYCTYCEKVVNLLEDLGLPYKEYKLGEDFSKEVIENLTYVLSGFKYTEDSITFPQVLQDHDEDYAILIGGYNDLDTYLQVKDMLNEELEEVENF